MPQRLLGRVVVALAATSVLTRDVVAAALRPVRRRPTTPPSSPTPTSPTRSSWSSSSPTPLSLEEMSKLWGVLDTPYLLSLTYLATVVLLEADVTPDASRCRCCSGS